MATSKPCFAAKCRDHKHLKCRAKRCECNCHIDGAHAWRGTAKALSHVRPLSDEEKAKHAKYIERGRERLRREGAI